MGMISIFTGENQLRDPGKKMFAGAAQSLLIVASDFEPPPPASAIIDGTLCQIDLLGARSVACAPLGSALVEFRQGPLQFYVREHPFGLLPGMANLYCLDANLRLRWMAEWPYADDYCAEIISDEGHVLVTRSASGKLVGLDAFNGRLLGCEQPFAEVG